MSLSLKKSFAAFSKDKIFVDTLRDILNSCLYLASLGTNEFKS